MNIDAIEKAAREATPGPWVAMPKPAPSYSDHGYRRVAAINGEAGPHVYALASNMLQPDRGYVLGKDAAHIAACDPQTVLEMCKVIRAAQTVAEKDKLNYHPKADFDALRSALAAIPPSVVRDKD